VRSSYWFDDFESAGIEYYQGQLKKECCSEECYGFGVKKIDFIRLQV